MKKSRTRSDHQKKKPVLDGILTAYDWDESGNITGVKLLTFDDDEYLIENGDLVLNLVKRTIRVTGVVRKSKKGFKKLKIETYSIVQ